MQNFKVSDESELAIALRAWVLALRPGDWIALEGDMGVGKTTFVRHVLRILGYQEPVVSPSFPILVEHELSSVDVVHVDAFRLTPESTDVFDIDDWKEKLVFVEWPQNTFISPKLFRFRVRLDWGESAHERSIEIHELDRDLSETRG